MNLADDLRALSSPYSKKDIHLLAEAAYNILYGVVLLTNKEKQYFKEHKEEVRFLVSSADWTSKRSALKEDLVEAIISAALRHLDG